MGDHHRNSMALRIGQDLTVSKSVYYHILKNTETQSGRVPFQGKKEGKKIDRALQLPPREETQNPENMKIPAADREASSDYISSEEKSFVTVFMSSFCLGFPFFLYIHLFDTGI